MMVGQSIGLIHDVPTCAELLSRMMEDAKRCVKTVKERIAAGLLDFEKEIS